MIAIQPLQELSKETFLQVLSGYTSRERYAVTLEESDAESAIRLRLETLAVPYTKDFTAEITPEDMQRYQALLPQGLSLAAWEETQMAAIAICGAEMWNRTLWIWEFHVRPDFQGQGIGRRLMDHLAEMGRTAGLRTMRVETQNTNVPAVRFYRRAGFRLEGIDVSFYTNSDLTSGEVALFLKRRLE